MEAVYWLFVVINVAYAVKCHMTSFSGLTIAEFVIFILMAFVPVVNFLVLIFIAKDFVENF